MTTISCPGKVLLAGGYLVLDRDYQGFVISSSARFYTHLRTSTSTTPNTIRVKSPQFKDAEWTFRVDFGGSGQGNTVTVLDSSGNPGKGFVGLSLSEGIKLAVGIKGHSEVIDKLKDLIEIFIVGDNEFYSQPPSSTPHPPFNKLKETLQTVHKTGLGSSAAMVSSLVGALIVHFDLVDSPTSDEGKTLIHNLSQYVHSLAQGKLGSGFDVSTAIWGGQIYKKFDQGCLAGLMEAEGSVDPQDLAYTLQPKHNVAWLSPTTKPEVKPFSLPPGLTILLADVDGGSNTPSMVGKVLTWRSKNEEQANELWNSISKSNNRLSKLFQDLKGKKNDVDYISTLKNYVDKTFENLNNQVQSNGSIDSTLFEIVKTIIDIRTNMRKMGEYASVPIEPIEQEKLIDSASKLPGVLGGGVPGAGGYDALWILTISDETTENGVREFLEGWKENGTKVKLLSSIPGGVPIDGDGLRNEDFLKVKGLDVLIDGKKQ